MTDQMIDLNSRARIKPYKHQMVGVQKLIDHPFFMLADEMGAGKTKQAIDAAQILYEADAIDRVFVIAPASVRAVWFDPELGELAKHVWTSQRGSVIEYHARSRGWEYGGSGQDRLRWLITNYDFIRSRERLKEILSFCTKKTLLILDESSAVKNHRALQTKACELIRKRCGRVILLNGTPIANSPLDLFSQANIMDPRILNCASFFHFRARYAVMGGYTVKGRAVQVIGWTNLGDLQQRMAPYVLRRLKSECLDLPPKLPSVVLTTTLTPDTWYLYKEMRDELVAWLDQQTASTAPQAVVKALRLAQLTSGFLGGVQSTDPEHQPDVPIREVGREKLDAFLEWYRQQLEADPNLKLLVWCRFRAELQRVVKELQKLDGLRPHLGMIWGGQRRDERELTLRLLDPRTAPQGPVVVVGTPASGAMGLNLAGSHTVIYLSNDYSLKTRLQSEDRVHRPGQTSAVSYFDLIATGPQGQKTIDHAIIRALIKKEEVANWTTSAWIQALREE